MTYYARRKVPERLQEAVARILDNGKARQVWLKKSLGTKVVAQANVRAKPVQIEFDRSLRKQRRNSNNVHFVAGKLVRIEKIGNAFDFDVTEAGAASCAIRALERTQGV